jgi:HEAT repeat protein
MKTRWFTWLAILLCVTLGGFAWRFFRHSEPTYQGRPASAWLAQYSRTSGPWSSSGIWPVPTNGEWKVECSVAKTAIHRMGTSVLPVLLRMASARDLAWKARAREIVVKRTPQKLAAMVLEMWPAAYPFQERQSAADGFKLLGPAAKSAVPDLVRLLNLSDKAVAANAAKCLGGIGPDARQAVPDLIKAVKDPDPHVREDAVFALGELGPSAEPAVDVLIEAANEPYQGVSFFALQSLGSIGAKPQVVIPLLLATLNKPQTDRTVYDVAIVGLGRFGAAAQSSAPSILPFLNDQIDYIRRDATNTLKQIGAGAASN